MYLQEYAPLTSPVIHSHLLLTPEQTHGYTRVFNLRADPVETVLSFIIADRYKQYHKRKNQDLPPQEPFNVNLADIECRCQGLIDWHNYYSTQLTDDDIVVVYEQMVELLTTPGIYDRIYPNKDEILLNYSEAKHICEQYRDQMLESSKIFLLHKNTQDIKNYINYAD